jgi:ATP-dependent Clp protease ATP-binding subunit ClpB
MGIDDLKKTKTEIESTRIESERCEREGQLARAAELKYGRLPELEKRLKYITDVIEKKTGQERMLKEEVGPEEIAEVIGKWTGIPVQKMLESETAKLLGMEDKLRLRVVGQDHALTVVSDAIRRARAEISDPNKPIGTFMFLGPTGVGKTETVKALADFLFDDDQAVARIDMSEYMEKHSVSRLIGAPPGYVGYEEGGQLTEVVRRRPYTVVLLDEIEKAHPDVFNVLLQVLDEGRLTDGQGRTVDFKNAVMIMTSNIGSPFLMDTSLTEDQKVKAVQDTLRTHFRPEFLNRVDEIVYFKPLGREQIKGIVKIQLEAVIERLKGRKISLVFDEKAIDDLCEKGFDPQFGARPLKRVIQTEVLNPLSKELIAGHFKAGDTVRVALGKVGIALTK